MYKRCKLERLSSIDCKRTVKIYNTKQKINNDFTLFVYNYIQNTNFIREDFRIMNNENDIFISSSTMMLEPCKHPYYRTKMIDSSGNPLHSCQTAIQLIKKSCLTHVHSTYQGRRRAVQINFKLKQNVPIPINHKEYICAFPTESPSSPNCIWLFYNHIEEIEFSKKTNKANIHFFNGTTITIQIGSHKLQQQFFKSGHILSRMNIKDSLHLKKTLPHLLP